MSGGYKGRNGVTFVDMGDRWRSHGSPNVQSPQEFDYKSRDDRPTGVKYGMGFDSVANGTRIAYVDYPKSLYTIEELMDGDEFAVVLQRCNVCHAMDQVTQSLGKRPYESVPKSHDLEVQSNSVPPSRVSAGNVISGALPVLPKYMSFGIKAAKQLGLKPIGDVTVSVGLSILSDFASGLVSDPSYKRALQSFSDEMIDSLDPDIIERVKQDAINIAEAAFKDSDPILSKKMIFSSMFKTRGDIKKEVSESRKSQSGPSDLGGSFSFAAQSPRSMVPPRLFE
jgi:hypothetical protein